MDINSVIYNIISASCLEIPLIHFLHTINLTTPDIVTGSHILCLIYFSYKFCINQTRTEISKFLMSLHMANSSNPHHLDIPTEMEHYYIIYFKRPPTLLSLLHIFILTTLLFIWPFLSAMFIVAPLLLLQLSALIFKEFLSWFYFCPLVFIVSFVSFNCRVCFLFLCAAQEMFDLFFRHQSISLINT